MSKNILITGSNGQLGNEIREIHTRYPEFNFILTDIAELDLTDKTAVAGFVADRQVDYIVNCAAYTAVDKAEEDEELCYRINRDAVRNLAEAAAGRAKLIHISTDYVFDGQATRPYRESDPTHPQSVYGKSKLAGEEILLSTCPESIILRTAWLYSVYGNNFVKTMLHLAKERPELRVVSDQTGTPTYAADLAQAILSILVHAETTGRFPAGIYHYSNRGVTSWFGFTEKILQLAGITGCRVLPISTDQYPTKAARPQYSVLDKTKISETFDPEIPEWEASLLQCIRKLGSVEALRATPLLTNEIQRRRTFAIISHPDAGKTTLTEKLLLFGGAIHVAGAVKSNKIKKTATSDWMEIEKQRGISVATSVMGFDYDGYKINILDTPGHQDFAEDTYRTLTAVDSVIIVVDIAKGVEAQTRKLMEVCRMRKTPVMIFVNKMDRDGKDPFDLLDELEQELRIGVRPLSWPVEQGVRFKGVYNLYEEKLDLYTPSKQTITESVEIKDIRSRELEKQIGPDLAEKLRADLELIEGVYSPFEVADYLQGNLAPVFFGSALNNFGVKELLDCFVRIAPSPRVVVAEERPVHPETDPFSGFIFKIHANMDPNHRSCIAFLKICSGKFERNAAYRHIRFDKLMKFSQATAFMAQKKETVDEAYAGDIIGLPDTGNFKIGDTLTAGERLHFKGLPSFSPEMFKYIDNADPMKTKQLNKGVDQLMDEGVAQLFIHQYNGRKIIGTVGQLQFEVIQYRLLHEYGAQCQWEALHLYKACWIESDSPEALENFKKRKYRYLALDRQGRDVFLADSAYVLQMAQQDFPEIRFHFRSEF